MKLKECNAYLHTYKCNKKDCIGCIYNPDVKLKENAKAADRKYRYSVNLVADGCSNGFIELTKKQADIVDFATDTRNWEDAKTEMHSGFFFIDTDNPIELTKDIKEYLLSDARYKNFTFIEEGAPLIDFLEVELLEDQREGLLIQVHSIEPLRDKKGNVNGITGFAGQCEVKNGEIVPLDGDTYNSDMTVYGYNWFTYSNLNMGSGRGLDILVGSDW